MNKRVYIAHEPSKYELKFKSKEVRQFCSANLLFLKWKDYISLIISVIAPKPNQDEHLIGYNAVISAVRFEDYKTLS